MQALQEEIDILQQVQDIDLEIISLNKKLDALPQREIILNARKKRSGIEAKQAQIASLKKDIVKRLNRIKDEDASLEKKENGVQAAIENASGDYRNVEARTKELNGIFKRRGDLAANRKEVEAELSKVNALEEQVTSALHDLDAAEANATDSFKKEGTALMQAIAAGKANREQLLGQISLDVAQLYTKTSKLFDTVCLGRLDGATCSVCRARIEGGRLIELKQSAPLANCPSCKRLLVIASE